MRRTILWFLLIALAGVAVLAGLMGVPALQDRLMIRVIERQVAAPRDALFGDDALRVLLCGSSSPFPHATRAKPCVAIFAAGRFWVVDTGLGSWNRLALWRVPGERIGGILLSHFHSDHIGALGEFDLQTWVAGRPGPLQVFGPPGVERVVAGFEEAYALDTGYRIAHHGAELLPEQAGRMRARPIAIPRSGSDSWTVLEEDGLRITAFAADHRPVAPAYSYRFDYAGRSVVVSGDTVATQRMVEMARDVDVLVHEAQANHIVARIQQAAAAAGRARVAKIMSDIPDYHTTPFEAARVANQAGARLLVFYHLTPPPPNPIVESIFLRGVADERPDGWLLGDDGLLVELPRGSDAIETRQLD